MRFEVLGPLRVRQGSEVVSMSGPLRCGLLALLLAHPNTAVSAEMLVAALWGEDVGLRGRQKLQVLVHQLRRAVPEPDRVEFESGGYRLRVLVDELDADRFDTLVTEAAVVDDLARRVELLRDGLGLWRGKPYQDLDIPALSAEAERLSERRLVAFEALFTAELGRGRHADVVPELSELVARYPMRERPCALLMIALHRSGRQADALAAYQLARRVLIEELGLEPGPELREVQRQILAGEPAGIGRSIAAVRARPAQLPHDVHGFVGRGAELSELDRISTAIDVSPPLVAVVGTAGVGKTALVTHWAHRARERFPDGQLYVDLRGYGPAAPLPSADALAGFLRALGVDGPLSEDPTESAARFRTLLDRRRTLVVLDNAATVEQVRPMLPGTSSCLVLITSRDSLAGLVAKDGAHRIHVNRMTVDDAQGLLEERLGPRTAEAAATASLIERCARLPLALCIAAERVGERRGSSIVDLDVELADELHRLDLFDTGDPHSSVRAVFSWSYRHLDPAAARLFRLCGLRPGHDIGIDALAALAGEDVRTTRRALDALVRAHLVDQVEGGRYRQHDLLWAYSAELAYAMDTEQERDGALTRLLDHYRHTASVATDYLYPEDVGVRPRIPAPATPVPDLAAPKDAEAWLEANHANLLAAAAYAGDHGWPAHTGDIVATLARHIRRRARHSDAQSLYSQALTAARTLGARSNEQAALAGLGHVARMAGRYAQAAEYYRQALAIASELGEWNEEVIALGGLGDTFFSTGNHRVAADHYRQMLAVARRGGCFLGELKALAGLGHSDMWSGRYAEGEDYYRQSVTVAREYGYRASGLTATLGLAHVHMLTGRYRQAAEYGRQGLRLARDLGHRLGELSALAGLGELYERSGHHEKAAESHEQALAIARAAGIHSSEVHVLVRLGHVHRETGNHARAAEHFELARTSAGDHDHFVGLVLALHGLGRTLCVTGDLLTALDHHRDGLVLAEKLELPREQAAAHDGTGHVHLALGEPEQARRHWQRALDISHELDLPEARAVRDQLGALDP